MTIPPPDHVDREATADDSPAPPVDSRVGQVIEGRYRIVRPLGGGGMGEVYEAAHTTIERRSAVKFLRAKYSERSSMLARFRREAKAAGRLEHENITAVLDFGLADGVPYLVMEYVEGKDLSRVLRRQGGPLPAPRAVGLILQAARGIAVAHDRGTIHRDLKPQNLFVCRRADGSDLVKVLDFGVAKMTDGSITDDGTATQTGTAVGTPCYMSPEQARGDKQIDERTDVYSLGLILYECLTGSRAFNGDGYNAILYQVLNKRPEPLTALRPDLPERLVAVVDRAIAFDPSDRFASVQHLEAALEDALERILSRGTEDGAVDGAEELGLRTVPHADGSERPGDATRDRASVPTPASADASAESQTASGVAGVYATVSGADGAGVRARRWPAKWLAVGTAIALGAAGALLLSTERGTAPGAQVAPSPPEPYGDPTATTAASANSATRAADGSAGGNQSEHPLAPAPSAGAHAGPAPSTLAPPSSRAASPPASHPAEHRRPGPPQKRPAVTFDRANPYE